MRPKIEKKTTRLRKPISAGERLSSSAISSIAPEVCDPIIETLAGEYMRFPSNEED